MDSDKFARLYRDASELLDPGRTRFLTELNVKCEKNSGDTKNNHLKTVIIEELSELIQAITKSQRGEDNKLNVIEEFVDVSIAMQYLIEIFNITDEQFNKAANVKLDRLERKIIECGKYE